MNPSRTDIARWVEMWVVADRLGHEPSYQDIDASDARGAIELVGAGLLEEGDAARLRTGGGERLTACRPASAEILVWEMHATVANHRPARGD
ncbi:MAG: hypothetical protein ACYDHH_07080 [Solirubrobacteraceae bacterium]